MRHCLRISLLPRPPPHIAPSRPDVAALQFVRRWRRVVVVVAAAAAVAGADRPTEHRGRRPLQRRLVGSVQHTVSARPAPRPAPYLICPALPPPDPSPASPTHCDPCPTLYPVVLQRACRQARPPVVSRHQPAAARPRLPRRRHLRGLRRHPDDARPAVSRARPLARRVQPRLCQAQ